MSALVAITFSLWSGFWLTLGLFTIARWAQMLRNPSDKTLIIRGAFADDGQSPSRPCKEPSAAICTALRLAASALASVRAREMRERKPATPASAFRGWRTHGILRISRASKGFNRSDAALTFVISLGIGMFLENPNPQTPQPSSVLGERPARSFEWITRLLRFVTSTVERR
jgi:hypothetical protein